MHSKRPAFFLAHRLASLAVLGAALTACGGGGGNDTVPDTFGFGVVEAAAPGLEYTSATAVISGFSAGKNVPVTIAGEGCRYAIGDGEYTNVDGMIRNGQPITVRVTTPSAFETSLACTVNVNGVEGTYALTTGKNTFAMTVAPGQLEFSWDGFAGVAEYQVLRSNHATGVTETMAEGIAGDAGSYRLDIPVYRLDWENDEFKLVACTAQSCASLPQHAAAVTPAMAVTAINYLKASNTGAVDVFGLSLALHGDLLAVGAPFEGSDGQGVNADQNNDNAPQSGAVYILRRNAEGVWAQEAYLKASNAAAGDQFGYAVALHGDRLAVGAPEKDGAGGAAYVFRRDAQGVWTEEGSYLKASNAEAGDRFGVSVALSSDALGDILAVGAYLESSAATGVSQVAAGDNGAADSGAVYVFRRGEAGWTQDAYVKASNTGAEDNFGFRVALHDNLLAVSATGEDSNGLVDDTDDNPEDDNSASNSGAVYLFRGDDQGLWAKEAYVKASNAAVGDNFGQALALHADVLAVGAYQQDDTAADSGAAYVFRRTDGAWAQEAYLKASNAGGDDVFGISVDIHADRLVVGAASEDSDAVAVNGGQDSDGAPQSGAAYVFERNAQGEWSQLAYLKASNTGDNDLFGYALQLDGDRLAVGAPQEASAATGVNGDQDNEEALNSGAVYVY